MVNLNLIREALNKQTNLCINNIRHAASYAPIDVLKQTQNNCDSVLKEKENCELIRKQLTILFKNRQIMFLDDNHSKMNEIDD